jgi:methionyl-tRNA synthetase
MTTADGSLIARSERAIAEAGEQIGLCHFRAGLEAGMSAAREANRYVEENAPWKLVKEDRERCATVLYTAICAIAGINVALSPYLPFTCQTLHGYLGNEGPLSAVGWRYAPPTPGQALADVQPLFKKLDPGVVEEEESRMAG